MASKLWTVRRRRKFLNALHETGNISAAARLAGVSRGGAYALKSADPEFAQDWDQALEGAVDALEQEARRRAVDGVETPHFHGGQITGTVRKYSDSLLMFLLRAHRPEKYREKVGSSVVSNDEAIAREIAEAKDRLAERLMGLGGGVEGEE